MVFIYTIHYYLHNIAEKQRQQKLVNQPKPPTQEQGSNSKYGQMFWAYLKWTKYTFFLAYVQNYFSLSPSLQLINFMQNKIL